MKAVRPWTPTGAEQTLSAPQVGDIIARDYTAWIVVSVVPFAPEDWGPHDLAVIEAHGRAAAPHAIALRRIHTTADTLADAHDVRLRFWPTRTPWWIYPTSHYPVCADCQQPQPCRQQDVDRIAAAEFARAARYSTPGHCPECATPVGKTHQPIAFDHNAIWPLAVPVVFHGNRRSCRIAAERYARHLATLPTR